MSKNEAHFDELFDRSHIDITSEFRFVGMANGAFRRALAVRRDGRNAYRTDWTRETLRPANHAGLAALPIEHRLGRSMGCGFVGVMPLLG